MNRTQLAWLGVVMGLLGLVTGLRGDAEAAATYWVAACVALHGANR